MSVTTLNAPLRHGGWRNFQGNFRGFIRREGFPPGHGGFRDALKIFLFDLLQEVYLLARRW
jgi:hypothetical protein